MLKHAMRWLAVIFALAVILFTAIPTHALDEDAETSIRLGVTLTNGDYVIGIPSEPALPVQTAFEKTKIPFKLIKSLRLKGDQKTASINFKNGDTLTGTLVLKNITLTTPYGKVEFERAEIARIATMRNVIPLAPVPPMPWEKLAVPWRERSGQCSVVFDDKMWVLGGRQGNTSFNDVWCTADGKQWEQANKKADWPARYGHVALVHEGRMWVLGGKAGKLTNDVWASDDGRKWELVSKNAPWDPRYVSAGFVKDGKMWIVGGHASPTGGKGKAYSDVWCSEDGREWTKVLDKAPWSARTSMAHAVYDDRMWILGGGSGNHLNDVWCSEDGREWIQATDEAPWPTRFGSSAIAHAGRLWMFGGQRAGPRLNDVWYTEDGKSWTQYNEHAQWRMRSSASALSHHGDLWILAGEYDYQKGIADAWRLDF